MAFTFADPAFLAPKGFNVLGMANLAAWYDASDAATITSSSGAVSQWDDKSTNGRHVTQSTAGSKPTTGSRTINGLNVIDFDGGDSLNRTSVSLSQPLTFYLVGINDASSGGSPFLGSRAGGDFAVVYRGTGWRTYAGTGALDVGTLGTTVHQWTSVMNTTSSQIFVDGTGSSTGSIGSATLANINMGDWYSFLDGCIAELIICANATRDAAAEAYLKAKWGTP